VYWIHQIHSNGKEIDRSAVAIKLRSRKNSRAHELVRWASEDSRRAGPEPRPARSDSPRGGTIGAWLRAPHAITRAFSPSTWAARTSKSS
jgi:hypothetical protein